MNARKWRYAAAAALLLPASLYAQDAAPDISPPPSVQVKGVRDPALMPYADLVMMRRVFADAAMPASILPALRVTGRSSGEPVPGLAVVLAARDAVLPVPLEAGFALLRQLPVSDDAEAEFRSNQRKGSLRMELLLTVALENPRRFPAGELGRAIDDGNRVRATVLPWYLRLLAPRFSEVAVCFAAPGATVSVAGVPRVAEPDHGSHCLALRPQENDAAALIETDTAPLYLQLR
ncbi:hypothetical protein [Pseudoduganella rhizocola]|uniref:hypothetical protein n=1 Tax=Pseudoduganella rhizocola TaxID=3382643 RepID=UPI0038B66A55